MARASTTCWATAANGWAGTEAFKKASRRLRASTLASPRAAALESRVAPAYSTTPRIRSSSASRPTYQAVSLLVRLSCSKRRLIVAQGIASTANVADQSLRTAVAEFIPQVTYVDLDDIVVAG